MTEPVLVYDDDCGFCTWWADFFAERSDLRLVGFSDLDDDLSERLPTDYERCSHLVTDGEVFSCGSSLEEAFARSSLGERARPAIRRLRAFGPYNGLREVGYRFVADRRGLWGRVLSKTPPARDRDAAKE